MKITHLKGGKERERERGQGRGERERGERRGEREREREACVDIIYMVHLVEINYFLFIYH